MYSNIVVINLNCGGSYIDSPNCIKKPIINPVKENDSKEFQYPTTVVLNKEEMGRNSQRISKV